MREQTLPVFPQHACPPFTHTHAHPPTNPPTPQPRVPQLFELLLTLAGSPRHQRLMAPALPELAALCVGYSQMSGAQEELWGEDANALLADEEGDIVGCR